MTTDELRKVLVIAQFAEETFSESEWARLGALTDSDDIIRNHPRLFRAMSFGDPDYSSCVHDVILGICKKSSGNIESVLEFFDISDWYKEKTPQKFERVFGKPNPPIAAFWKTGYLKVFISHLATSKEKATQLKTALLEYGMDCFVAHEDIEPTKEWMSEIEAGLNTMDALIAMVEPGFKESNWTDQEIGFALARRSEIVPLRMGADPHGFLGKYQGIQAKGRYAADIAIDILKILLKKKDIRKPLLSSLYLVLKTDTSKDRLKKLNQIEQFETLNSSEMVELLENAGLTYGDKVSLAAIIKKYGAFKTATTSPPPEDDLPF